MGLAGLGLLQCYLDVLIFCYNECAHLNEGSNTAVIKYSASLLRSTYCPKQPRSCVGFRSVTVRGREKIVGLTRVQGEFTPQTCVRCELPSVLLPDPCLVPYNGKLALLNTVPFVFHRRGSLGSAYKCKHLNSKTTTFIRTSVGKQKSQAKQKHHGVHECDGTVDQNSPAFELSEVFETDLLFR